MIKKRYFTPFVFYLAALVALLPHAAFGVDVLDVRLGFNAPNTRFVLETNTPVDARTFTLQNPPRLVIDIPTVRHQKINLNRVDLPPEGIVTKVRDGVFSRTTHRFVLELKTSAHYKKFSIPQRGEQSPRLVIDLNPKGPFVTQAPKTVQAVTTPPVPQKRFTPPSAAQEKDDKPLIVIVDAGHGGIDPGALGRRGTREKDVVLEMARRVAAALNRKKGVKAYLTRDGDVFLKLQERVDKAKSLNADLFVSLHADAHKSRRVRGGSVYVLSESASEREAERLSILANRGVAPLGGLESVGKDGVVQDILIDLAQRDTMNNSAFLAKSIIGEMGKVTYMRRTDILFAGFKVLKAPDIPSILIELAYMSNPEEEKKLRLASFQQQLADSVAQGIVKYHQSIQ